MNGQLGNLIMGLIASALLGLIGLAHTHVTSSIETVADSVNKVEERVQIVESTVSDVKTKQEMYAPSIEKVGEISTGVAVMQSEMEHMKAEQEKTNRGIEAIQRMLQTRPANAGPTQ